MEINTLSLVLGIILSVSISSNIITILAIRSWFKLASNNPVYAIESFFMQVSQIHGCTIEFDDYGKVNKIYCSSCKISCIIEDNGKTSAIIKPCEPPLIPTDDY